MAEYQVQEVRLSVAQRGFVAEAFVHVATRRQSTDELLQVMSSGRSKLGAMWNLWREIRAAARNAQDAPGSFDLAPTHNWPSLLP